MTTDTIYAGRFRAREFLVLTVVLCVFFLFMLGNRPLSVPDEGRYVEIPREMVSTGDYLTPRLNGVKYFEKPALFYWLEAFSIKLFGLHEFSLRLWPALFAVTGCLSVYLAGGRLYGRKSGLFAAVVLATSLLYYAMSRAILLDMPVSILLCISLLSFLLGTHETPGIKRRMLMWSFYAFAALAVLTKGLIGLLIPAMVIGAWILFLGEWRILRSMYIWSGAALFLLISAPWHIMIGTANPDFFDFYFVREHFQRYLTKIEHHYEPPWFFIPVLAGGLFPWSAFLIQAITHSMPSSWRERHEHRDAFFLALWAGLVFLFFSASGSKLVPYILPVLPPLAILIGRYLAGAWDRRDFPGLRAGYAALAFTALALAAAFIALPRLWSAPEARALGAAPAVLGTILIAGAALTWLMAGRRGTHAALYSLAACFAVFLLVMNAYSSRLDTRSVKSLALTLRPLLRPGDAVAAYKTYYQDLPVYLERRITVVDWRGELRFGTTIEDTGQWMIDTPVFWKRWAGPATMYMVTRKKTYDGLLGEGRKGLYLVAGTNENVLISNKEIKP